MPLFKKSSDELLEALQTTTDKNLLKQIQAEVIRRGEEEDKKIAQRWGISEDDE